jgi:hypothetical protein
VLRVIVIRNLLHPLFWTSKVRKPKLAISLISPDVSKPAQGCESRWQKPIVNPTLGRARSGSVLTCLIHTCDICHCLGLKSATSIGYLMKPDYRLAEPCSPRRTGRSKVQKVSCPSPNSRSPLFWSKNSPSPIGFHRKMSCANALSGLPVYRLDRKLTSLLKLA